MPTIASKRASALAQLRDADLAALLTDPRTIDGLLYDLNDIGQTTSLPADEDEQEDAERWSGLE